ncbi:MAG: ThuA domain-containing protein [Oscillospiraceae bacterium]|nr:ThuA domain-containing protein [Oscillospiraceae bacterium]
MKKKILYFNGGADPVHQTEYVGKQILAPLFERDGRFEIEFTADLDKLLTLEGNYDAVFFFCTGFNDQMTAERFKALSEFVKNGGGFAGSHCAADSFKENLDYIDMLGGMFVTHPPEYEYTVHLTDADHYITENLKDFKVWDELYLLSHFKPECVNLLGKTTYQGIERPVLWTKDYGLGKIAYVGIGGNHNTAWTNPKFQKLVMRMVAWVCKCQKREPLNWAIVGYGGMGEYHSTMDAKTSGIKDLRLKAICDIDPARVDIAKEKLPWLEGYYTSLDAMLKEQKLDLVTVPVPHNVHAPVIDKCLDAGVNVISEKPFTITVAEAEGLIKKAEEKGLMLSVFHNRRWDSDFLEMKKLIGRGTIGDVYHVAYNGIGYHHPGYAWRSDKEISGGIFYDWGAHIVDWILHYIPSKITQVMARTQKRVWHSVTNQDHAEIYITFENGASAMFMTSHIATAKRPPIQIFGTRGSIEKLDENRLAVTTVERDGSRFDSVYEMKHEGDWKDYYRNVCDHLVRGEPLEVTARSAKRVIGVFEAAKLSAQKGASVPPIEGCE